MNRAQAPRAAALDYRPSFPEQRGAVARLGGGTAAKDLHLPAYEAWSVDVSGVWDLLPSAVEGVRERFPFVRRVYGSLDEVLPIPRSSPSTSRRVRRSARR